MNEQPRFLEGLLSHDPPGCHATTSLLHRSGEASMVRRASGRAMEASLLRPLTPLPRQRRRPPGAIRPEGWPLCGKVGQALQWEGLGNSVEMVAWSPPPMDFPAPPPDPL